MKVLLALSLVAAVVAAAHARVAAPEELTAFDYHRRFGIPAAARLLAAEEELLKDPGRIVGGSNVDVEEYPFQAGIIAPLTSGFTSVCGASLLSNTRLVTAAHCWFDGNSQATHFTVILGSSFLFVGGTQVQSLSVVVHENWTPRTISNDIAMIYIDWVDFSHNIQPIRLPSGTELNNDFSGEWAIASGFGRTSDTQTGIPIGQLLSHVALQVITNLRCRLSYGTTVSSTNICTSGDGGVGACGGDSGGPLSVESAGSRVLVGVVSFGSGRGCEAGQPSAYVRITSYINWILQRL